MLVIGSTLTVSAKYLGTYLSLTSCGRKIPRRLNSTSAMAAGKIDLAPIRVQTRSLY